VFVSVKNIIKKTLILFFFVFCFYETQAQDECPTCSALFTVDVDLSSNPDSVWISPGLDRSSAQCCHGQGSERCIRFMVKTHPSAVQLGFTLAEPPIPPSMLYS